MATVKTSLLGGLGEARRIVKKGLYYKYKKECRFVRRKKVQKVCVLETRYEKEPVRILEARSEKRYWTITYFGLK